jgi:hypothetical protein
MNGSVGMGCSCEDLQQYIIPTLSKTKISHHLSYPIGAKEANGRCKLALTPVHNRYTHVHVQRACN